MGKFDEPVSLRVHMTSPMLGAPLLTFPAPSDPGRTVRWRPCPVVLPPPVPPAPAAPSLDRLELLTTELIAAVYVQQRLIQALQADLASRTWSARWHRFVARCTDLWRRIRS